MAALAGWLIGCGAPSLGTVAVFRTHPDTLLVQVVPDDSPLRHTPPPDVLALTVSDARGFVLAERRVRTGASWVWRLPIADAALPSRGRIMVEVCGHVAQRFVCEQRPVTASPKRVQASVRLAYPVHGDRERAIARVEAVAFERYDGARWWPTPVPVGLTYALHVWVDGASEAPLTLPLRTGRDTVQLTSDAGYDVYWLHLNERIFYGEGTRVHLSVRARWPGGEAEMAHALRTVRPFTSDERQASIEAFARGAARGVARTLGLPPDSARVRVSAWRFDRIRQRYTLDLTMVLRDTTGALVRRSGRLDVGEGGQDALFRERGTGADSLRVPLVLRLGRLPIGP